MLALICAGILNIFTSSLHASDYWQQYVHYNMDIKLDVNEKTVGGISIIEYVNNSPNILNNIYRWWVITPSCVLMDWRTLQIRLSFVMPNIDS